MLQLLNQNKQSPSSDFWMTLAPSIVLLIGAVIGYIKLQTIDKKADEAKVIQKEASVKADVAHDKADVTSKAIEVIGKEVNTKADHAVQKASDQETVVLSMTKEIAELKSKLLAFELKSAEQSVSPQLLSDIVAATLAKMPTK